jgi:broad specificity phosphatase PhoE
MKSPETETNILLMRHAQSEWNIRLMALEKRRDQREITGEEFTTQLKTLTSSSHPDVLNASLTELGICKIFP